MKTNQSYRCDFTKVFCFPWLKWFCYNYLSIYIDIIFSRFIIIIIIIIIVVVVTVSSSQSSSRSCVFLVLVMVQYVIYVALVLGVGTDSGWHLSKLLDVKDGNRGVASQH